LPLITSKTPQKVTGNIGTRYWQFLLQLATISDPDFETFENHYHQHHQLQEDRLDEVRDFRYTYLIKSARKD